MAVAHRDSESWQFVTASIDCFGTAYPPGMFFLPRHLHIHGLAPLLIEVVDSSQLPARTSGLMRPPVNRRAVHLQTQARTSDDEYGTFRSVPIVASRE